MHGAAISVKQAVNIFWPAFLLCAVIILPRTTHAGIIINTPTNVLGMAMHLTFDGPRLLTNVRDNSSQGNNGFLPGQTSTTTVPGVLGQALVFDGSDDYVSVPDHSTIDLTADFTIALWFKVSGVDQYDILYSKGGSGLQFGFGGSGGASPGFFMCKNGILCYMNNAGTYSLNKWHHVAFTRSADLWTLYIDGVEAHNFTDPVTIDGTATDLTIGKESNSDIRYVTGALDDYRIYTRALSAREVAKLHRDGAGVKMSITSTVPAAGGGLIGHWTFDGPDMLVNVRDRGTGGNNGYLLGQASTTTVPGKFGQAITFDGVDDSVLVESTTLIADADQTVCSWFYQKSGAPTRFNAVVNNTQFYISIDTFFDPDISIGVSNNGGVNQASSASLKTNTWYHLCTTRASGITNIYINGALSGAADQNGGTQTTTIFPIGIGESSILGSNYFYGHLDDVRIYNRVLSVAEIRALYGSKITIRRPVAGWYDSGDPDSANGNTDGGASGFGFYRPNIILPGGTVSKLRIHMASASFSQGISLGLYDGSGNLVATAKTGANTTGTNFWQETNTSTSPTISAGNYTIAAQFLGNGSDFEFSSLSGQPNGTTYSNTSDCTYASAPCDPIPDNEQNNTIDMYVGVYITP